MGVFDAIDVLQLEKVTSVRSELGSGENRRPGRSLARFRDPLVMRRHKIGRVDRIQLTRFWKVSFEMGGVDLDLQQIPATPAAGSSMIFVRLICARRARDVRARQDGSGAHDYIVGNGLTA